MFWKTWQEFEVEHGNEDTVREMLRIKRSVQASHSTVNLLVQENIVVPSDRDVERAQGDKDSMRRLEEQMAIAAGMSDQNVTDGTSPSLSL